MFGKRRKRFLWVSFLSWGKGRERFLGLRFWFRFGKRREKNFLELTLGLSEGETGSRA